MIRQQDIDVDYANNSSVGGDIELGTLRTYNYSAKSTIKGVIGPITFMPSKVTSDSVVYTICDSNLSVRPRQISVTKLAVIRNQAGGDCP